MVRVGLNDRAYYFHIYDTPLGKRFLQALKDNIEQKRILEKNFCFLGFADSKRDLRFLCQDVGGCLGPYVEDCWGDVRWLFIQC